MLLTLKFKPFLFISLFCVFYVVSFASFVPFSVRCFIMFTCAMLSLRCNDLNEGTQMSRLNVCIRVYDCAHAHSFRTKSRKHGHKRCVHLGCVRVCVFFLHSFDHSFCCLSDGASEFISVDDFRVFLISIQWCFNRFCIFISSIRTLPSLWIWMTVYGPWLRCYCLIVPFENAAMCIVLRICVFEKMFVCVCD